MITETHTFKTVNGCSIRVDAYLPDRTDSPPPVIFWIHGGGLICGTRKMLDRRQLQKYIESGYAVFAPDYRLAPETKLPSIIEDIKDAYSWVRGEGSRLFDIDSTRLAVVGHSAGGYLALMAGCCVSPKPRAIVSFYGYCDFLGHWYLKPNPGYLEEHQFTRDEAYAAVKPHPISEDDGSKFPFYVYTRRHGLWAEEICGFDPQKEPDLAVPLCPGRNVVSDYPPTLLIHGDIDSDVPYEQSLLMADALTKASVENHVIIGKGREHGYDVLADDPEAIRAMDMVFRFLGRHLMH